MQTKKENLSERPPIVVVMGHIDHGKSSLLDYIRKSNITGAEAGGITQHLGAYEIEHKGKKITFLDTPGHEAFSKMRARGARVADIAVLVVSAVEGVQAQTVESLRAIKESSIPFIVAINKIDRPEANAQKTKMGMADQGVFLEGFGGTVSSVDISAKTGAGVEELLDLVTLTAELADLKGDREKEAGGVVIESDLDSRRGNAGTLMLTDGTLAKGHFLLIDNIISPVRMLRDFLGNDVEKVSFSSPVKVSGLSQVPRVGSVFRSFKKKKEAEAAITTNEKISQPNDLRGLNENEGENPKLVLPMIVKADYQGSLEALTAQFLKLEKPELKIKIIRAGLGNINENDLRLASSAAEPLVIGFNVKFEKGTLDLADKYKITPQIFEIIYKAAEYLEDEIKKRLPRVIDEAKLLGKARVLKIFSKSKERQIVGGVVMEGVMLVGKEVRIIRRENLIDKGRIVQLQQLKQKVSQIEKGSQFGGMIEARIGIAEDDVLEIYDSL